VVFRQRFCPDEATLDWETTWAGVLNREFALVKLLFDRGATWVVSTHDFALVRLRFKKVCCMSDDRYFGPRVYRDEATLSWVAAWVNDCFFLIQSVH
jgi:hypothetical protein